VAGGLGGKLVLQILIPGGDERHHHLPTSHTPLGPQPGATTTSNVNEVDTMLMKSSSHVTSKEMTYHQLPADLWHPLLGEIWEMLGKKLQVCLLCVWMFFVPSTGSCNVARNGAIPAIRFVVGWQTRVDMQLKLNAEQC